MFVNIIFMLFFEAFAQMSNEDVCSLKPDHGGCRSILVRWYYNSDRNRCERFIFGGCGGNQNNFVTQERCQRHCLPQLRTDDICSQPIYSGPCRSYLKRFWYNNETRKCEQFIYGGCDENANNFQNAEDCLKACNAIGVEFRKPNVTKRSTKMTFCELSPDRGSCSNFTSRYFFNATNQKCEKFVFGGCAGNDNNFNSLKECRSLCKRRKSIAVTETSVFSKCKLPKRIGFCKGRFNRFFFNVSSHSCEPFVFGGCLGNANNFKSLQKCEETCALRIY